LFFFLVLILISFFLKLLTCILPFRCYIKLYDSPPKAAAEEAEAAVAGLPAAERKKMRQKLRKAEAKAKKVCDELQNWKLGLGILYKFPYWGSKTRQLLQFQTMSLFCLSCPFQEAEEKAKEEEIKETVASKGGKKSTQTPRPVDTDPDGDKLMHVCALSHLYM
jgi:hypothetical protein